MQFPTLFILYLYTSYYSYVLGYLVRISEYYSHANIYVSLPARGRAVYIDGRRTCPRRGRIAAGKTREEPGRGVSVEGEARECPGRTGESATGDGSGAGRCAADAERSR